MSHNDINSLLSEADVLLDRKDYINARLKYRQCYNELPEPKTFHEHGWRIIVSIAECNLFSGEIDMAIKALENASRDEEYNGFQNPFVMLRLGQAYYEKGDNKNAADRMTRAYALAGLEIFDGEDAKYLNFLKGMIKMV